MAVVMPIGAQQNFGKAGCTFGAETAIQLGSGLTNTPARGLYMCLTSANDLVEYTPDSGTTFRTMEAAGGGAIFYADGFNVRIRNTGIADAGAVKTFLTQILAVPGI